MLGIFVSHIVSKLINHHGYDEILIIRKGVPFLETEVPHELGDLGLAAVDFCSPLPDAALLAPQSTKEAVKEALRLQEVCLFPVLEPSNGACMGFVTRARLEKTLRALRR